AIAGVHEGGAHDVLVVGGLVDGVADLREGLVVVVDGNRKRPGTDAHAQRTGAHHLAGTAGEGVRGELVRARQVADLDVIAAGDGGVGRARGEKFGRGSRDGTRGKHVDGLERRE